MMHMFNARLRSNDQPELTVLCQLITQETSDPRFPEAEMLMLSQGTQDCVPFFLDAFQRCTDTR
jgi:hypothetical protein